MEVRKMENNNLCECYEEELGYSVWVQSDESGLWFNMNDILRTFKLADRNRRWLAEKSGEDNKIILDFYRDNRKVREYFISESMVHEVIALNRKETKQAERFIYSIIKDYDENVSVNDGTEYYSTEERMALHILQVDYNKFLDDHQEQLEILKDKPIVDEMEEFKRYFDYYLDDCEVEYCKKRVPQDIRDEEYEKRTQNKNTDNNNNLNDLCDDELDILFKAGC
jgi:hypothetical protein